MPPDDGRRVEERDAVAEEREIVRAADPGRAGADDRHAGAGRPRPRDAGPADEAATGGAPSVFSTPCRSVSVRLSARIEIGWSMMPRRHFVSQGCAQMRPQMEARGFGARAIW